MNLLHIDDFIRQKQNHPFPANSYVYFPGFNHLYVRVTSRFVCGKQIENVIDIANIEAVNPGNGAFKNLIAHLREIFPTYSLYIENVSSKQFRKGLVRMGFVPVGSTEPPSYILD